MKILRMLLFSVLLIPAIAQTGEAPPRRSTLEYTSYGAGRVVSGSLHLVSFDGDLLILDAGQFMSGDGEGAPEFPAELLPRIPAIILSHIHADHAGRLLELVKDGFQGKIYCSLPTRELMPVMLGMSARHGDFGRETFYYSRNAERRNRRRGENTIAHVRTDCDWGARIREPARMLASRGELEGRGFYMCRNCARLEVEDVIEMTEIVEPGEVYRITPRLTADFFLTPHLPGSLMVRVTNPETGASLLYTGDFGTGLSPFLPPQEQVDRATWAIIEGTYSLEGRPIDSPESFRKFVGEKVREGKRVIIPSFVLDRAQQVLYQISKGIREGVIPEDQKVKIFSPSIEEINRIYSETFRQERYARYFTEEFRRDGPFDPIGVFPERGDDEVGYGEIASSSSGMADAGFALEAVKRWVGDPDTLFLFVGYQAPGTVGGKLTRLGRTEEFTLRDGSVVSGVVEQENVAAVLLRTEEGRRTIPRAAIVRQRPGTASVTIDGRTYPVRAEIRNMSSFSGHGRPDQIRDFLSGIEGLRDVLIVHADPNVIHLLGAYYRQELPGVNFHIPRMGEKLTFTHPPR